MELKDIMEGDLDKQWVWGGMGSRGGCAVVDKMDTQENSQEGKTGNLEGCGLGGGG